MPDKDKDTSVTLNLRLSPDFMAALTTAVQVRFGAQDARFAGLTGADLLKAVVQAHLNEVLLGAAQQVAANEAQRLREEGVQRASDLIKELQLQLQPEP